MVLVLILDYIICVYTEDGFSLNTGVTKIVCTPEKPVNYFNSTKLGPWYSLILDSVSVLENLAYREYTENRLPTMPSNI